MPRTIALSSALALLFTVRGSLAQLEAKVPAGGGLPAVDVVVDLEASVLRVGAYTVPIALARDRLPAASEVTAETVAIGLGRQVVHVRVPAKGEGGLEWEALVAGGRSDPIFAGVTGLVDGDPGERSGKAIEIMPNGDESFVLVGDVREDLGICGQSTTLLDPFALYPASLELRPATVQRLAAETREKAIDVAATATGHGLDVPLARLLVARGTSVSGAAAGALTDLDASTTWSEERPGAGQGEFVVMSAPHGVPISRLEVMVGPADAAPGLNAAAPRTFYLVADAEAFRVALPEDAWQKRAQAFQIVLPHPIATSCLALVLADATLPRLAHPDVTLSELTAYSEFDGPDKTLDWVASKLSSERGSAAAAVLERAGDAALAAVERAYDALDARGKALAMDVAAAQAQCEQASPLLVRGLCEVAGQAPRKAREKLGRCQAAATVLAKKLVDDDATRACIAPALAAIAPTKALVPLADAIAKASADSRETKAALRSSLAHAIESSPREALAALLAAPSRSLESKLEILRAAGPRVAVVHAESSAAVTDLWRESPSMRIRYLSLDPIAALARAGDSGAVALLDHVLAGDADWPVRAHAAEVVSGEGALPPALEPALVRAEGDREPRVREAALAALAPRPSPAAVVAAQAILATDSWPFVRTKAVLLLANAPASVEVDEALAVAAEDGSADVRAAVLYSLGQRRATSSRPVLRERLNDKGEDADVRAAAAQALGAVCDARSLDPLTEWARQLGVREASDEDRRIAFGAIAGLAQLRPKDLASRLAPLRSADAPPEARKAAERALQEHGSCTWRP
ncbi:MAG: HEAT repeat domain-containing protein [Polyangiaceae bacterium]|jgi:HEAT repeat protein